MTHGSDPRGGDPDGDPNRGDPTRAAVDHRAPAADRASRDAFRGDRRPLDRPPLDWRMLDWRAFAWGAARRVHRASFFLTSAVTFGVRTFVRDEGGAVFLVRHGYMDGWHLPGGGVDVGETGEAAALRELREESGLAGEAARLFGLYLNARLGRDQVALYVVERFSVAAPPPRGREIADSGFFPVADLPAATTPSTRRRIAEVVEGAAADRYW
jgi:ADP-ribose pyrophosphatase YjhB (NUDIX family)